MRKSCVNIRYKKNQYTITLSIFRIGIYNVIIICLTLYSAYAFANGNLLGSDLFFADCTRKITYPSNVV